MDEKRKEVEAREFTPDEIDEMIFQEQIASGEYDEEVPEYCFSNPDPYAKVEPRSYDAPKRKKILNSLFKGHADISTSQNSSHTPSESV